jgi:hypothetical protein
MKNKRFKLPKIRNSKQQDNQSMRSQEVGENEKNVRIWGGTPGKDGKSGYAG